MGVRLHLALQGPLHEPPYLIADDSNLFCEIGLCLAASTACSIVPSMEVATFFHGYRLIYRLETAVSKIHAGLFDFDGGTSKPSITCNHSVFN